MDAVVKDSLLDSSSVGVQTNAQENVVAKSSTSLQNLDSDVEKNAEKCDKYDIFTMKRGDANMEEVAAKLEELESPKKNVDIKEENMNTEAKISEGSEQEQILAKSEEINVKKELETIPESTNAECLEKNHEIAEDDDKENNKETSRKADESSIPYYSLPKPGEYGTFKSAVSKNLEISLKGTSAPKEGNQNLKTDEGKEDDIIFLGFFESPTKTNLTYQGSSSTPCVRESSAMATAPGLFNHNYPESSSAMAPRTEVPNLNYRPPMPPTAEVNNYGCYPGSSSSVAPMSVIVNFPSAVVSMSAPMDYDNNVGQTTVMIPMAGLGSFSFYQGPVPAMAPMPGSLNYDSHPGPNSYNIYQSPVPAMTPRAEVANNDFRQISSSTMTPSSMNFNNSPRMFSPADPIPRFEGSRPSHSIVHETPGAKHEMLKKNLMEKMRLSKEQKLLKLREMENIDNEEDASNSDFNEQEQESDDDLEKDSDIINLGSPITDYFKNKDLDPPMFSSLPSYQPGGGFKSSRDKNCSALECEAEECASSEKDSNQCPRNDFGEINPLDVINEPLLSNDDECEDEEYASSEDGSYTGDECDEEDEECASSEKDLCTGDEREEEEHVSTESNNLNQVKKESEFDSRNMWGSYSNFEEDSVLEICSGAFPATNNSEHGLENSGSSLKHTAEHESDDSVSSWKSSFKENKSTSKEGVKRPPMSPQENDETVSRQPKRRRLVSYSDESDDDCEDTQKSPKPFIANTKNKQYVSDSDDSNNEDEDPEINIIDVEKDVEDIKMKKSLCRDLIEDEAELSGEEGSSDENEDEGSAVEEIDDVNEEVDIPESELFEMGKIHLKKLNADDDKLLKKIKNDFLDEGELHDENGVRSRKFKWSSPSTSNEIEILESSDSEDDNKVHVDQDKLKWLKETSAGGPEDLPNDLPSSEKKLKLKILTKSNISVNEKEAEKRTKVKRGSFLKKDAEVKEVPKDLVKNIPTPKGKFFGSMQGKPSNS